MTTKSYIDEKVDEADAEIMDWFYETCRINFDVEGMVQDSTQVRTILQQVIEDAYVKGRDDERHDDSPMGEGLFEGRKLKELSRPELYRAIGRFDGLYRSALQSHE